MRRVSGPTQRLWVISALLVALVVRALIPAGFMPATDRPLSFQVCPDGFPAGLLGDATGSAGHDDGVGLSQAPGAALHTAYHDGDGTASADFSNGAQATAHAAHHHHAGSDPDGGALAHHDLPAALLAHAHHHDGPGHNHSSANTEHCVFAAAAGAFALAFLATFSAPASTLRAPEVPYLSPAFESRRFHIPQPRGPPVLS